MTGGRRALAWGVALTCLTLTSSALALGISDGRLTSELLTGDTGFQAVMGLTLPVLGALLIVNGHRRLGWLFSLTGASRAVAIATTQWALHDFLSHGSLPLGGFMSYVSLLALLVAPGLGALTLLWFPDGSLPDARRRWRLGLVGVGFSALGLLLVAVSAWSYRGLSLVDDSDPPTALAGVALALTVLGALMGILVGLLGLVARLRGSDAVARQQTKWILLGAGAAVLLNLLGDVLARAGFLNLLGTVAMEVAVVVAVRRYALWDVDRLLQRTVVYSLVSVMLIAVYAGVVLGLGLLFDRVSHGQSVAVAAAALAAAVLAGPAHRMLQGRVDRRFDRRTHDAVKQLGSLSSPSPESLEELLGRVLHDSELRLVFRCNSSDLVDAHGRPAVEPEHGTSCASGWVAHRVFGPEDSRRARIVLGAAAEPLAFSRLQAELRVQLAVLEQSRHRIVEAADEERRRVERDLHDGAQQRLVALAIRLRSEQRSHALSDEAHRIIELGVEEITASVQDLRSLAAGILPGSLVTEGLCAALRDLVDRQPQPVRCELSVDHPHPAQVEATAWFVASEGLANCLKHAPESAVWVEAACDGSSLSISVRDNGPGGGTLGLGLIGLQDRVAAGAGTLVLTSSAAAGTTLRAVLPCGS